MAQLWIVAGPNGAGETNCRAVQISVGTYVDRYGYHQELLGRSGEVGKISPDTVRGYRLLSEAAARTGKLDAKTRERIALAVAVTRQCDDCVTVHTAAAVRSGATREEVAEALGVAIAVNAGAALVFPARVMDALTVTQA